MISSRLFVTFDHCILSDHSPRTSATILVIVMSDREDVHFSLQCEHPVVPFQSIFTRILTEMVVHCENLKKSSKGKREFYSHARWVPPVWLDEIEILVDHYDFPGDYHG